MTAFDICPECTASCIPGPLPEIYKALSLYVFCDCIINFNLVSTEPLGISRTMVIIISASVSTFFVTAIIMISIIMIVLGSTMFRRKKKGITV